MILWARMEEERLDGKVHEAKKMEKGKGEGKRVSEKGVWSKGRKIGGRV